MTVMMVTHLRVARRGAGGPGINTPSTSHLVVNGQMKPAATTISAQTSQRGRLPMPVWPEVSQSTPNGLHRPVRSASSASSSRE